MGRILLFCATVFTSAFLLFQVQPVIGKCILPWFGSTPGVWTTCMLFFQVLLLLGYAYAHFVISRLSRPRQAWVHGTLLLVAACTLPIAPSSAYVPEAGDAPVGGILLVLAMSVGLPYLVLSTTGPLLQGWFARLHPGRSPYRLYALSNVGSLLALISYPFLVEPAWGLATQTTIWSIAFGVFALLCGGCAWALYRGQAAAPVVPRAAVPPERAGAEVFGEGAAGARPGWGSALLWFLLAATGSAMLLATTNQICMDVAVVPFLWIAPLAIYLLSFILTFDHERWYVRPLFLALLPVMLLWSFLLLAEGVESDITAQVVVYALTLFIVCMCCHGELSRSKPAPAHLTWFFLVVSIGGAAGGLLVALVAPNVFADFHEFPYLLVASHVVVAVALFRNLGLEPTPVGPQPWWRLLRTPGLVAALVIGLIVTVRILDPTTWQDPEAGRKFDRVAAWLDRARIWILVPALGVPLLLEVLRRVRGVAARTWWSGLRVNALGAAAIVAGVGAVAFTAAAGYVTRPSTARVIAMDRNFYGALTIKEWYPRGDNWDWTLKHGRIMHGFQLKRRPTWPTSYYGPESGVGLAIRFHPQRDAPDRAFRMGVIGLGTGTLAAYANTTLDPIVTWEDRASYVTERRRDPGDVVRYYEINPMVVDWAERHFTFLSDARARGADVDVFVGDARLVMERQLTRDEGQAFDVLAVDAFSSDAIPLHLLTKESFEVYRRHLAPGGALVIHVTNRYIDLKPAVRRLAREIGLEVVHVEGFGHDPFGIDTSDWMVLTDNEALLRELRLVEEVDAATPPVVAPTVWTDDYSSVWTYVKNKPASFDDLLRLLGFERNDDEEADEESD